MVFIARAVAPMLPGCDGPTNTIRILSNTQISPIMRQNYCMRNKMGKKESPHLSLVVLLSGHGSTLQAIIDAIQTHRLQAHIKAVISDKADVYGLKRATQANIPSTIVPRLASEARKQYDQKLLQAITNTQPDLVILAGFMRILGPELVAAFTGKMLNIHPSLLPKYPGLDTHARALANGDTKHGSSVHFVTNELDGGPLLAQVQCPILPNDTPETLEQRGQTLRTSTLSTSNPMVCRKTSAINTWGCYVG